MATTLAKCALSALVLVCTTACATKLPLKRVIGDFSFPARGELNVERRFVVRSVGEWARQWERISPKVYDPSGRRVPGRNPLPAIDFRREMVLIAEMGLRGSGFDVSIGQVIDRGSFIEAEVWQFSPDRRCHFPADEETPTDVVRVSASSKPVRWSVFNEVRPCVGPPPPPPPPAVPVPR